MIITTTKDGYLATLVYWSPDEQPASLRPTCAIPLARDGNKLTGSYEVPGASKFVVEFTHHSESRVITWPKSTDPVAASLVREDRSWMKVTDGTAYPAPP